MLAIIKTAALIGIDGLEVTIEVDSAPGLPKEIIVGLPDTVVKESRTRIKSAIKNSGFKYPIKVYTLNLAPAEIQKEGPFFDVPMALGILATTKQSEIDPESLYIGELSLNGEIKPIRGILSICHMALKNGYKRIFIPHENQQEASLIKGIKIVPVKTITDITDILNNNAKEPEIKHHFQPAPTSLLEMSDIKGQHHAKRALMIAATGHHNLLLSGPPGSGKTMLLKRLPGLMPDLSIDEAIETHKIHSIANQTKKTFTYERPFRAPHHSASYAGMVGGGRTPQPGEISLAHNGILFLDELPEFQRQVLEVLRQPLEEQSITLSRAQYSVDYPANFLCVAAMNPCPCGYQTDPLTPCTCPPNTIEKYRKKVSGPILDRFDIKIDVPRLKKTDYDDTQPKTSNTELKQQIDTARQAQYHRQKKSNARLSPKELKAHAPLPEESHHFLAEAVEKGLLTARAHDKVIKVARTIADLEGEDYIQHNTILEALQYQS